MNLTDRKYSYVHSTQMYTYCVHIEYEYTLSTHTQAYGAQTQTLLYSISSSLTPSLLPNVATTANSLED